MVIALAAFIGPAAFFWPFVVAPGKFSSAYAPPLIFETLLVLVLCVVICEIAEGGINSKALAMLGVLSAVNAAIRPPGAGTAGIETVFFLLVLAGRVCGPGFGFTLGRTSLFASALITGGVGPWMPYQLFGCLTLAGPAVRTVLRRAARKARFQAPITFAPPKGRTPCVPSTSSPTRKPPITSTESSADGTTRT